MSMEWRPEYDWKCDHDWDEPDTLDPHCGKCGILQSHFTKELKRIYGWTAP